LLSPCGLSCAGSLDHVAYRTDHGDAIAAGVRFGCVLAPVMGLKRGILKHVAAQDRANVVMAERLRSLLNLIAARP
jgi:hypothetical protein